MLISMFLNVLLMVHYTRQMLLTSILARQRVNDRNRRAEQREGPREGVSLLIFNTLFSSYIASSYRYNLCYRTLITHNI